MKLNVNSILEQLNSAGVALPDRAFLLSITASRAISYSLSLPTSPVENPYLHFTTQHRAGAEAMLAEINEQIVIDIDTTMEIISRMWVFRYRVAFDPTNRAVRDFLDGLLKAGSREIPPKVSEWLIRYENTDAVDNLTSYIFNSLKSGA